MKLLFAITVLLCAGISDVMSQQITAQAREANKLYKQKQYDKALPAYQKALGAGAKDPITHYNFGNALFRNSRFEEAAMSYDRTLADNSNADLKQKAFYNKGVSFSKQQKLEESIDAYKQAVLMNPADEDARVNLQKALLELKKKQPPEQQKKEDNKKKQDKKNQQNKPKSNLTKKQVEQLLKALQQREQQVQQKMQQSRNRTSGQQEKDW